MADYLRFELKERGWKSREVIMILYFITQYFYLPESILAFSACMNIILCFILPEKYNVGRNQIYLST